jgi:hypothetical protein
MALQAVYPNELQIYELRRNTAYNISADWLNLSTQLLFDGLCPIAFVVLDRSRHFQLMRLRDAKKISAPLQSHGQGVFEKSYVG